MSTTTSSQNAGQAATATTQNIGIVAAAADHVQVDHGPHVLHRDDPALDEGLAAEQAAFLGAEGHEEDGPAGGVGDEILGQLEDPAGSGGVVVRAVVDLAGAPHGPGPSDPAVVMVPADNQDLVGKGGDGSGQQGGGVEALQILDLERDQECYRSRKE